MQKGFTLAEVLIATAIVLVLSAAIANVAKESMVLNRASSARMNADLEGRRAIRTVITELRGATTITATSTDSVSLTADLNADGIAEAIRFFRDTDGSLKRESAGQVRNLASNLGSTTPLFTYSGRFVSIRFSIGGKEHSSGVTLRNIE